MQARTTIPAGPVLPTLLRLALPTTIVLVAQTAVNVAEAYYIGYLGTDALAGVALVFPVFMLMTMMSNGGLGSGVASAVARATGAGQRNDADALVLHAMVLAVIVGATFTVGTHWGGPALYRILGGRDGALDTAVKYSNYLFAGSIPVWIVNFQAAALRGSGNVRVPAMVTLLGAVVLIPCSPLLIFGLGPIPRLGIAGAGIAFGLYYVTAMLVLLHYMTTGRSGLSLKLGALQSRLFKDILKVGLPTAISTTLTNLTVILVTGAVGLFGTHSLAGYGIASRLDYVMIPTLFGLCTAVLTMVGVNMGAGQVARAKRIAWTSSLVGAGVAGTIGVTSRSSRCCGCICSVTTRRWLVRARFIFGSWRRPMPGWGSASSSHSPRKAPGTGCGHSSGRPRRCCSPPAAAGLRSPTLVAEWPPSPPWSAHRCCFTRCSARSR
jgi:putative MATE family efflux protein